MRIETQAQADHFNEQGTTDPYRAFNGHKMIAPLERPRVARNEWGGWETRPFQIGDELRYRSFAAWCAEDCLACGEGEPLPDW